MQSRDPGLLIGKTRYGNVKDILGISVQILRVSDATQRVVVTVVTVNQKESLSKLAQVDTYHFHLQQM